MSYLPSPISAEDDDLLSLLLDDADNDDLSPPLDGSVLAEGEVPTKKAKEGRLLFCYCNITSNCL